MDARRASPPTSAASRAATPWPRYAIKANSSLGVLRVFAEAGCGFDIVSGGELARVLAAGADPAKVIFSGVGKTHAEMRQALAAGIGCFNVESEAELDVLNAVGARRRTPRGGQHPHQSERRPEDASLHLDRPQGQQVRRRPRPRGRRSTGMRLRCKGLRGGRHRLPHRLADHRRLALPRGPRARARPGRGHREGRHPAAPPRLRRRPGHRLQRRHAPAADALWQQLLRASTRAASDGAG